MVYGLVKTFQAALKYRGGWRGLIEHMYTVSGSLRAGQFCFGTCSKSANSNSTLQMDGLYTGSNSHTPFFLFIHYLEWRLSV